MLKNSTVTWEWIFSHMKKIESVLRSSMAQERMYNLALLNTEQDIVHKMDFTNIIDLFIAAKKTGKDCFKCFVLRTCNFAFRSHLFLYQKFFCCHFNLNFFFQFVRLLHFQKSYMNTKLTFEVGPGPLISPVRQGPCGLNWALLRDSPQVSNSPTPSTSPLPCSEDHHLPLSDCEFSLMY